MLVLKYTFIRPNTSVPFYLSSTPEFNNAVTAAKESGDIISSTPVVNRLSLTITTSFPSQEAFDRISSNSIFVKNKQERTAFHINNGITELVELTIN